MNDAAARLLAKTTLVVDRGPFALASWPRTQASAVHIGVLRARRIPYFVAEDEHECTALVHEAALRELPPPRQAEYGWCVLTLDQVMTWDVIGVLALLTSTLADAGVSVGAVTAFSRDHVLVQVARLDAACDALRPLCREIVPRGRG